MHLQIRTVAKLSPPDIEKLLGILTEAGVDLAGIGGSNIEFGGEVAIVPKDEHEDLAKETLTNAGYVWRELRIGRDPELSLLHVENKPGGLHECLVEVAAANLAAGRIIRDILVGVPDAEDVANGTVPVHVYSEQVRTPNSLG